MLQVLFQLRLARAPLWLHLLLAAFAQLVHLFAQLEHLRGARLRLRLRVAQLRSRFVGRFAGCVRFDFEPRHRLRGGTPLQIEDDRQDEGDDRDDERDTRHG